MAAISFEKIEIIKLLIDSEVDINEKVSEWWRLGYKEENARRKTKHHCLGYKTAIDIAVEMNYIEPVKLLIDNKVVLNSALLSVAMEHQNIEIVKELIDAKILEITNDDVLGENIYKSFSHHDTTTVEIIINNRKNDKCITSALVNSIKFSNSDFLYWFENSDFFSTYINSDEFNNVIVEIIKQSDLSAFELLEENNVEINRNNYTMPLIFSATLKDDTLLFDKLLKHEILITEIDSNGNNLLDFTVKNNKINSLTYLNKHNLLEKFDLNKIYNDSSNVLIIASKNNSYKISEILVNANCNINIVDTNGYSSLDYSIINKNDSLTKFLTTKGALTGFNINKTFQNDKQIVYYNGKYVCRKKEAVYYAFIDSLNNKWNIEKYRMNGKIYMAGTYSDCNLTKANGIFIFYYGDSLVYEYQEYKDSRLIGGEYANGIFPEPKIYVIVEEMPTFIGGDLALRKWIKENVKYPNITRESDIQGKVYVRFVVMWDGSIDKVTIARGVDPLLDKEALEVIKKLPYFNPGFQNGRPVNVWYTVPVDFQLQ